MWILDLEKTHIININFVKTFYIRDGSVRAKGDMHDDYVLFKGTTAECVDYFDELERALDSGTEMKIKCS